MDSKTDKANGDVNEQVGKMKRGVGEALDSDKLKEEGRRQEHKGKAQKAIGDTEDALDRAADETDRL